MASAGTSGSHEQASQPGSGTRRLATLLGGVVETCRVPSARLPPLEKSTPSEVTMARDVSAWIASPSRPSEDEDARRHSPIRDRATQGRTAIARSRTARSPLLTGEDITQRSPRRQVKSGMREDGSRAACVQRESPSPEAI
jgi:hypothetical protein